MSLKAFSLLRMPLPIKIPTALKAILQYYFCLKLVLFSKCITNISTIRPFCPSKTYHVLLWPSADFPGFPFLLSNLNSFHLGNTLKPNTLSSSATFLGTSEMISLSPSLIIYTFANSSSTSRGESLCSKPFFLITNSILQ